MALSWAEPNWVVAETELAAAAVAWYSAPSRRGGVAHAAWRRRRFAPDWDPTRWYYQNFEDEPTVRLSKFLTSDQEDVWEIFQHEDNYGSARI